MGEEVAIVDAELLGVLSTELGVGRTEEEELLEADSIELDDAAAATEELEDEEESADEVGSPSVLPPTTSPCPSSIPPLTPKPSGECEDTTNLEWRTSSERSSRSVDVREFRAYIDAKISYILLTGVGAACTLKRTAKICSSQAMTGATNIPKRKGWWRGSQKNVRVSLKEGKHRWR